MKSLLTGLLALLLLAACNPPQTGPAQVRWDRDTCEHCRMVLSDRLHAAQVRFRDRQGRSRVRKFDDIGCAIVWLQDKAWRDAADTEIWVKDYRNGKWIDARSAHYVTGHATPMEYGLGAQADAAPGSMDFAAAQRHVMKREEYNQDHGGHRHP